MAGDWIPMRVDLADDPAVISIALALGLDEFGVVGRLQKLWAWANAHLVDGLARGVSVQWLDRYLGTPGFAAAMLDAGWLRTRSGGIEFPHFDRWNSRGAKRRLTKTQWESNKRATSRPDVDPEPTICGHSMSTKSPPEKRREEKKNKTLSGPEAGAGRGEGEQPKPRKRNPLFDAVAEITGSDPIVTGAHVGKVAAGLARGEPPYTPDEVREFGERFWELCSWAKDAGRDRPTLGEVEKNIGKLRASKPTTQRPKIKRATDNPLIAASFRDTFADHPEEDHSRGYSH